MKSRTTMTSPPKKVYPLVKKKFNKSKKRLVRTNPKIKSKGHAISLIMENDDMREGIKNKVRNRLSS